jgi:predicted nicotinamide N-methyase
MSEKRRHGWQVANDAAEEAAGVPLATFQFSFAGRDWSIRAARDHESLMAAAERFVAFPFGLLLWESAQALAEVLADYRDLIVGRSVLELGAGVGFPGIVAGALGAASVRQTDHVFEALALCVANAKANGIEGIEVALANWDAWTDAGTYDLIIGSDVVYERSAHAALVAILDRNLAGGGRVLLADPGRQDTPLFLRDLADAGWQSQRRRRCTVPSMLPGGPDTVDVDIIELWR